MEDHCETLLLSVADMNKVISTLRGHTPTDDLAFFRRALERARVFGRSELMIVTKIIA